MWYASAMEKSPASCAGRWLEEHGNGATQIHLDLGCGKGAFAVQAAAKRPDVLFVGIDCEDKCIALAAQSACEAHVPNAIFVLADADDIASYFAAGELGRIYLNFSAPYPQAKYAERRLTHASRLAEYAKLLAPCAQVWIKTDSQPFFDWSLAQLGLAGYTTLAKTRDLRARTDATTCKPARRDLAIDDDLLYVETEFERLLVGKGAKIHAACVLPPAMPATPVKDNVGGAAEDPTPDAIAQVPASLVDWLPQDLESMEYVPYGMESTVENILNRRANLAAKAARRSL